MTFKEFWDISVWVMSMQLSIDRVNAILYIVFKILQGLTPIGYTYISSILMDQIIEIGLKRQLDAE